MLRQWIYITPTVDVTNSKETVVHNGIVNFTKDCESRTRANMTGIKLGVNDFNDVLGSFSISEMVLEIRVPNETNPMWRA